LNGLKGRLPEEGKMNPALALMAIYIISTVVLQVIAFFVSEVISMAYPGVSLMTFLVLFMAMFWLGWPIAVRITYWLIPETEAERVRDSKSAEGQRLARQERSSRP
jgi:hypothetical protein